MCGMITSLEVSWKGRAERILLGTSESKAKAIRKEKEDLKGCDPFLIHVRDLNGKMSIMDKLTEDLEQQKLMDFIVRS